MTEGRTAALFDFDNTLLGTDGARIGFTYLWKQGMVPVSFILKVLWANLLFKRGWISDDRMSATLYSYYRGRSVDEFTDGSEAYYHEYLKPLLSPAVVRRLREHQQQGHHVAILSASARYILQPVADDLQVDTLLCSHLERSEDGTFTGHTVGPAVIGNHKVDIARQWSAAQGIDLASSWAYGDHISDAGLLELVGHPVAVRPERRLETYARHKGWEILREL